MKASVGIVILKTKSEKKILVGTSKQTDDRYMKLSFPGGQVDPGESFSHAAEREVWEETGIKASVQKQYLTFEDQPDIRFYFLDYSSGKRKPNEEFENLYFMTLDEIINHKDVYEQNLKILQYIKDHNLIS